MDKDDDYDGLNSGNWCEEFEMENGEERGPRGRKIQWDTWKKIMKDLDYGPDDLFDRMFGWMFFWVDWFRTEDQHEMHKAHKHEETMEEKKVYEMYGLDYEYETYKKLWFFEKWFYDYDHSARSMMRSSAVMGYGVPTRGTYCLGHKGYKTFGTVGQGPIPRGVKEVLLDEC